MVPIQCNGTIKTISFNKKLEVEIKRPQILLCYDLLKGLTNEKENMIFETKSKLFSIGTITISKEIISLLSIKISKIKIDEEYEPQQRTLSQGAMKVVLSTTKKQQNLMLNQRYHFS